MGPIMPTKNEALVTRVPSNLDLQEQITDIRRVLLEVQGAIERLMKHFGETGAKEKTDAGE